MPGTNPEQVALQNEASSDWGLVSEVLAKDRKATAAFVSQCADWIYPFVRRRLFPKAEAAEDLMQEILFATWQALPNYRGDGKQMTWCKTSFSWFTATAKRSTGQRAQPGSGSSKWPFIALSPVAAT
jgi:DNA-directed RNA polymerase specialized sigma24 family protein